MKKEQYTSCFLRVTVCTKCDWFQRPLLDFFPVPMPPRVICPNCGEALTETTGRFEIEEERGFFGQLKSRQYVAFKPRDDAAAKNDA